MSIFTENCDELSRAVAAIKAAEEKRKNSNPIVKDDVITERHIELVGHGFSNAQAQAIITIESDPEIRRKITLEVASQMFGPGVLKESLSAVYIPKT